MTAAPTVGVCGFGRCGSTMAMAMLAAGGVAPAGTVDAVSHELVGGIGIAGRLAPAELDGRSVKILDAVLYPAEIALPRPVGWRLVWLDRDGRQQSRSQIKLLRGGGLRVPLSVAQDLARSYRRDRGRALDALRGLGPVHVDSYEHALADPAGFAADLAAFLRPDLPLDVEAAAAVVHRRSPRCAPGLDFESSGRRPA